MGQDQVSATLVVTSEISRREKKKGDSWEAEEWADIGAGAPVTIVFLSTGLLPMLDGCHVLSSRASGGFTGIGLAVFTAQHGWARLG